jgi:hypothetical protein
MPAIRFTVDRVDIAPNGLLVPGRLDKGPLRLGSIFVEVKGRDGNREAVHLTVEKIMAYQNSLKELSEGWTAQLLLTGSGMNRLTNALCPATMIGASHLLQMRSAQRPF